MLDTPLSGASHELIEALDDAWGELVRGATSRRAGCHTVTLATTGLDGVPELRTVVLRHASPSERTLRIHTDIRARKVAEVMARPAVAVLAYCATRKLQIRVNGTATVHHNDDIARSAWEKTQAMSRRCYRILLGPGTVLADPSDEPEVPDEPLHPDHGFEAFAVVKIHVSRLEWVALAFEANRRARYTWDQDRMTATWLIA